MASAIHVTERGESLGAVAGDYYALKHGDSPSDARQRQRVMQAIRAATAE